MPWSFARQIPMHVSGTMAQALTSVKNNPQNGKQTRPMIAFIDDEVLRAPDLRNDYEFSYLHQFMRMRSASLSVWPQEITHVRPRQSKGEQFVCVYSGTISLKMISPVFAQNMY